MENIHPIRLRPEGIIKAIPVSVYLGNDWELSHFNTLMFVAISVSAACTAVHL